MGCLFSAAAVVFTLACLPALHASYCPITVSYEVSLGQAPIAAASHSTTGVPNDFSDIPIFFAKVGIFSNNVRSVYNCFPTTPALSRSCVLRL